MKKFLASLILSVFLINISTPKAEAGVGILALGAGLEVIADADHSSDAHGLLLLSGILYGGMAAIAGSAIGGITAIFAPHLGVKIIYGSLILDADGSLPRTKLVQDFSRQYSFIDNQDVIENLADSINQKYLAQKTGNEAVVVRFSAEEVQDIFSATDLTESQLALITNDLK